MTRHTLWNGPSKFVYPRKIRSSILNTMLQLVASLPATSKTRSDLTNAFIDELWNSLQHPPMSYLGDKFQYRQADGSYNVSFPAALQLFGSDKIVEYLVPPPRCRKHPLRPLCCSKYHHAGCSARSWACL